VTSACQRAASPGRVPARVCKGVTGRSVSTAPGRIANIRILSLKLLLPSALPTASSEAFPAEPAVSSVSSRAGSPRVPSRDDDASTFLPHCNIEDATQIDVAAYVEIPGPRQPDSSMTCTSSPGNGPASFARISALPAASSRALMLLPYDRSSACARTLTPCFAPIAFAAPAIVARVRKMICKLHRPAASLAAMAWPIPLAAPVTTAVRPLDPRSILFLAVRGARRSRGEVV
jgi:hypothetical protein